jgi:hypothetical protein
MIVEGGICIVLSFTGQPSYAEGPGRTEADRVGLKMEPVLTGRKELRSAPSVAALPQRGVESLFPTDVVDGPEDLRSVSSGET